MTQRFKKANVVLVGNEKGGSGKTTVSVNIAAMAAAAGMDTLLIDADPGQQSASKWAAERRASHPEAPIVRCVALRGASIQEELSDLAARYAVVVVDTGASDSAELRAGALACSVLVVPVQPESIDLWTLPTMERIWTRATALNPAMRLVVAVNRIPAHAQHMAADDVTSWMGANVPKLATACVLPIVGRSAHGRATSEGLGVTELRKPDPKASAEVTRLFKEVMR